MTTITKKFGSFAMGHRQHAHAGHCAFGHGHSVFVEIVLSSTDKDENGFVLDFGQMKELKEIYTAFLDHKFLVNDNDPKLKMFRKLNDERIIDLVIVPNVSAESMAEFLFYQTRKWLANHKDKRVANYVWIKSLTFHEDEKNSATYEEGKR